MIDEGRYKVADLIEYQTGSVVSRTLINKPVGTVTLFSFDEGQGLSEHTAPYDALIQVIDGEADITVSGVTYRTGAGEMVMMKAGSPHSLQAVRPFKMILTMVRA